MSSEARRLALIVASSHFTDKTLQQLLAPGQDAAALARVLADPVLGNFEVEQLLDRPSHQVRRAIEAFFCGRKRDDLLLLYFSGHGLKEDDGRLYLATIDTERGLPLATTVPASFVNDTMNACQSRRQVLILDCCHSGAFASGMIARAADQESVDIPERFQGHGRVVLTASSSLQYAFEGDKIRGEASRSVFTNHLVRGLETGHADLDGDGWVALGELYDYIYARVIDETPKQKPGLWAFKVEGELLIARSPTGQRPPGPEEQHLAEDYAQAMAALTAGHWQDALLDFEKLLAERPIYRDVAERVRPLRKLAAGMQNLGPAAGRLQGLIARLAVLTAVLTVLLPNLAASAFNYTYNRLTVIDGHPERKVAFQYAALAINVIGFPVGMALVAWLAWPVGSALGRLGAKDGMVAEELKRLRRRCLNLGHYCAVLGIFEWLLAGPIYPVAIGLWGGSMPASDNIYFLISLALGGLIAAAYPFFGLTFLFVRVVYAALIRPGSTSVEDRISLERLEGLTWGYLLLAGAVPILTMTLVFLSDVTSQPALLGILGLSSLAGLGLAFGLCRMIKKDLEVLKQAVARSRPGRGESHGDSVSIR